MLTNGKNPPKYLRYGGCSCHNSKQQRRVVKKMLRRKEQRQWKRDLDNN